MADWHQPLPEEQRAWHLLNRVTFGPRPGDVARVEKMGAKAFLEEQLHPERINDSAVERKLAGLPTLSMTSEELAENFPAKNQAQQQAQARAQERGKGSEGSDSAEMTRPNPGRDMAAMPGPGAMQEPEGPRRITMELAREQLWRAIYSQRQLEEVMVQFWMNHFNIFAGKGADRWLITSFERQAIRPHALGKFEDLLVATARSPAMLFYLDNWLSVAPYTTTEGSVYRTLSGMAPETEEPGRPAAVRPVTWNPSRFPQSPGQQRPRPFAKLQNRRGLNENYARELMELHTLGVEGGYTQQDVREVARCFTGWTINRPLQGGSFFFNPRLHDFGAKVVLRHKIKPGGGEADGHEVLHMLAHHPSTAHFISLKLCRRFVADDPPASLVNRAGKAFLESKGDLRAVLRSIVTSPEFNSSAAFRAKVKSPFELVASSLRALDGQTDAGPPLLAAMVRMGQPLFYYQAPTGFPDRGSAWINSGTLLQRINFATLLAANRIRGTQVDLHAVAPDSGPNEVAKELSDRLVGGELSPETRQAIVKTVDGSEAPGMGGPWAASALKVVAVLVASPDFQRR
jgi:uncharacterized protein (DUF1800 family)